MELIIHSCEKDPVIGDKNIFADRCKARLAGGINYINGRQLLVEAKDIEVKFDGPDDMGVGTTDVSFEISCNEHDFIAPLLDDLCTDFAEGWLHHILEANRYSFAISARSSRAYAGYLFDCSGYGKKIF